ncbi:MAG: NPCBM/NEW2 domain-containing protein [Planctomycetaceae bacterium]|nr:NPCBM/NEW2 domain-containing protein [Planctomycetaceae bacterium]
MHHALAFAAAVCLAGMPVDVAQLDGQRLSGELQSLTKSGLVVAVAGESRTIPLSELQEVQANAASSPDARSGTLRSEISVTLRDGSVLLPQQFSASTREATLVHPKLGELKVPKAAIAHVRLARTDQGLSAAWDALLERSQRNDLVVVRKGEALDHVEGVVGAITAESLSLLLEGRPLPIPRNRVFGVIYASADVATKPVCRFDLIDGQQLAASAARYEGDAFVIDLVAGGSMTVAASDVRRIDFSLGKIRLLADLEPTSVEYPSGLPTELADVWKFRRGRNSRGEPLLLGGETRADGLWIHSGTTLRYRLGREFRRLQGQMGIDEDIGDCAPTVGVVVRGDGRVLLEQSVSRGDSVQSIDLDVAGVRELEIVVTSNDPDGICEHLDLVEARLIK